MTMEPPTSFTLVTLLLLILNSPLGVLSGADQYSKSDFPADFVFGSGTSAYQVEGAAYEDGRTSSIWDTFAHDGFAHGENGDVACDGYHKYKEDVQLMVETGLDAYRFSISWSRLIPNGRGPVNPKGLDYYNNLINELIRNGIQPHVTLHNYDLPQTLEDEYEGWLSRDVIRDFTDYADVCFREFGDRVLYWTTVNEPNVFAFGGYDQGNGPPRRCSPPFCAITNNTRGNSTFELYLVVHHILLAHSSAVRLYRTKYRDQQRGVVGISIYTFGMTPQTNKEEDTIATQRARDFFVGWIMEPLIYGDYPISMKKNIGARIPTFTSCESKQVQGSYDFIGVIHYMNMNISDNYGALNIKLRDFNGDMAVNLIHDDLYSNTEYSVTPWGLQQELDKFKLLYGNPPLFILENGQRTASNSSLLDLSRVKYFHGYIGAVLDALRNGSNVKGYFAWSFMDVFELLDGYSASYGLYYVDRNDPELKRYPKLSAKWYKWFLMGRTSSIELVENEKDPSLVSNLGPLFE
ncbi:hydroxyisourate hydrolase-like isoform X1 [Trifolium pratense]|uniref:hydroxyisourate hydrolase-like isoform X1 n=1 Tax=Trifolium pratense TaxID=57577 RepID=UPI001E697354|nr:hydroxyisourate hydrolase-like isoform X1 [Trifolium pratense]